MMIDIEDHHFFWGGTSSDSTRPPGDDGSSIFKPWKYDRNIGRAWTYLEIHGNMWENNEQI
jgi:hypothetical protein